MDVEMEEIDKRWARGGRFQDTQLIVCEEWSSTGDLCILEKDTEGIDSQMDRLRGEVFS